MGNGLNPYASVFETNHKLPQSSSPILVLNPYATVFETNIKLPQSSSPIPHEVKVAKARPLKATANIFVPLFSLEHLSESNLPSSVVNSVFHEQNPSPNPFITELNPFAEPFTPKSYEKGKKGEVKTLKEDESNESYDLQFVLDMTPTLQNISTPNLSFCSDVYEESSSSPHSIFKNNYERGAYVFIFIISLTILFALLFQLNEEANDENDPHSVIQALRLKNIDRVILGHININSIRNKIDLLFDMLSDRVDIILISETKLDKTFPKSQFMRHGYSEPYRLDRTAYGGGLLLYVRNDIPTRELPLVTGSIECIMIEATVAKKKWLIIGAYNPHKATISNYLSVVEKSLNHYLPSYDNVVLLGDLNSEIDEEDLENFCQLYHLKSLIKTPTCFKSNENPTCIDLILTNRQQSFQNSKTIETGLSDFHHLTLTVMKTKFRKLPPKKILYRDNRNYNSVNFCNDVIAHFAGRDLTKIPHDQYMCEVMTIFNHHKPVKTKYIRGNDQPFMNKELRKEHMKRTRLLNKYRKEKTICNELAYKKQRNHCVSLLRIMKKEYYEKLKPSSICDNISFWKVTKPLCSDKPMSSDSITLIEKKEIISDDQTVASIFSSFFSNAVRNLNIDYYEHFSWDRYFVCNEIEKDDPILKAIEKYEDHPSIIKIRELNDSNKVFSFKPINLDSVRKEIENLNIKKSSPIESLPASVLKEMIDIISPKILIDFNSAVKTGIFPHTPKLADVSPLFKKGIKQSKENYRPVSVLSAMSKVFGRQMLKQTRDYMKDFLSIFLCAYTSGMNAQNCLTFMVEKWRKSLDKGGKCGVLLTDLSKAFDCLVHDLFIAKLHAYGFDYLALKLIYSYLTDRFQRIKVNACYSEWTRIDIGVPQGSVLGGEFYNYNSNDLFLFMLLDIANYADDNSPFAVAPTIPQVISNLEQEAITLLYWIKINGMKANPDKFHLLLSENERSYSMQVGKYEIESTPLEKLLGVMKDSKMTFSEHVNSLCTKASNKLHMLSRVSNYMSLIQRKTIMASFILSQFGYCPLVWMFHSRKMNNRINRIHERSLRIVYQDYHASFEELLESDSSFTIHHRNIQTLCIELYKVAYGIAPELMKLVFPLNPRGRFVWEDIFQTHNVRTTSWGIETLGHLGPRIWSLIPTEYKKLSLSKFINEIRMWKPEKCPCKLCKVWVKDVGYVNVAT